MVHAAHASRYHWGQVGGPQQLAIGEWQCARVYSVLGRAEPALHHARRCLEIATAGDVPDWLIASAHEGMARAYAGRRHSASRRWHRARLPRPPWQRSPTRRTGRSSRTTSRRYRCEDLAHEVNCRL